MSSAAAPIFQLEDVHKAFGGTVALDGVTFSLAQGEVHALIGENGAGKSTLMRVLGGEVRCDRGTMHFEGNPWTPSGPHDARRAGVAMIHQELALAPHLSVAENIALGCEPPGVGWGRMRPLARRTMRATARTALATLGFDDIDPESTIDAIGPGQRQIVEIARAIASKARVLVMDEPTTSLSREDAARVLEVVGRLQRDGASIVYISHFLEEVCAIADRWTVLRDGKSVAEGAMEGTTNNTLIEAMTGRPLDEIFPKRTPKMGGVRLRAENISGIDRPSSASIDVRRGEIIGLSGLVGGGRTEFLRVLAGLDPMKGGTLSIDGNDVPPSASVKQRLVYGCGLLSEDRKSEGLALSMSIAVNMLLSRLGTATSMWFLRTPQMTAQSNELIERLGVKVSDAWDAVGTLSGGNQQKVALARLLHQEASVLFLDEPTRGIDVGSKVQIYRLLDQLALAGCSIVVSSGYAPELLGLCDRIAVMHRGVLGPLRAAGECSEASLMREAVFGSNEKECVA